MTASVKNSDPQPPDKSFRWVPWVIVPLMFIIYASNPTRKYYFDGVVFASIMEHGPWQSLFNPHHLLYTWAFSVIENLIENISGREVKALYIMQWANIIIGSITIGFLWKVISRLVEDKGFALLVVLLGCFSFTYWHYATDADVYIISTLFLILAADRLELIIRHRPPRNSDFALIGIFHALSILTHQLNIFWIVCIAACLLFRAIDAPGTQRWKWWWIYLASMVIPVGGLYLGIGILALGHTNPGSFMHWITEYGHESAYWCPFKDIPYMTLNGYLMVFFHRFSIMTGILDYNLIQAVEEGRFWKGITKVVFGYYSLGFLFFCYLAGVYNIKKFFMQYRRRSIFLFSWLAPYVVFQLFFMPTNYFYKLFIFIPLLTIFAWFGTVQVTAEKKWFKWPLFAFFVIFSGIFLPRLAILVAIFIIVFEIYQARKANLYRWGLFILVGFLALYNYISAILPESKLEKNPEVIHALALESHFRDGDLLIFEGGYDYPNGWIISALTPARVVALSNLYEMPASEREDIFNTTILDGGRIFIHPNIVQCSDIVVKRAAELGITIDELATVLDNLNPVEGFELEGQQFIQLQP